MTGPKASFSGAFVFLEPFPPTWKMRGGQQGDNARSGCDALQVSPAERLGELLRDARRAGREFDGAWEAALRRALEPTSDPDWAVALRATRDAWASAFERRPAPLKERATLRLLPDVDAERFPDDARICRRCGEMIPSSRKGPAKYCSRQCQRAGSLERLTAAA